MPTYENFNVGWAENDGDLDHTATRSTWTSMRRDASAWFVKDFGAGYFGTFICGFTLRLTDLVPDSTTWRGLALAWMQVADDWQGNADKLGIRINGSDTAGKFRIGIVENDGTGNASTALLPFDEDQDYYIIFRKIGTLTILEIYSDKDHSVLEGYVSLTMRNAVAFRYMLAPTSLFFGGDPGDFTSGYVEYLTLDPQFGRDLAARFLIAKASVDLQADLEIRHSETADILCNTIIYNSGILELLGQTFIINSQTSELLSKFSVGHIALPSELLCKCQIIRSDHVELYCKLEICRASNDLFARALIRCENCAELYGRLTATRVGSPLEFPVRFIARHSDTLNLLNQFYVRPKESTYDEFIIGGRDRRLNIGGMDREITVGGRDRRMRIR